MIFYRLLITLTAPLLTGLLFVRVLRRSERLQDFLERLGIWRDLPTDEVIWLHGASNGEMTSARQLIESLLRQTPPKKLVLSCNSTSGKKMMQSWNLPNTYIRLAPLDLAWIYRRLFKRMQVQQFIVLEADFWPNRMRAAQQLGIPTALIAGRMSSKSLRMWRRFPSLSKQLFAGFSLVCPQDARSLERLAQLGVQSDAIGPQILLKSLVVSDAATGDFSERAKFWLAASTHDGEDDILLRAHLEAQKSEPDLRMILAPRHPKRGDQIAQMARSLGFSVTQRSKGAQLAQRSNVYIADTLGEMATWYATAATCFVAGSLVAKGGHTPFEPVGFGCAILHGPHLENFADPYATLQAHQGAYLCETAEDIAMRVVALTDEEHARLLCSNAREALSQRDPLEPVLEALSQSSKT